MSRTTGEKARARYLRVAGQHAEVWLAFDRKVFGEDRLYDCLPSVESHAVKEEHPHAPSRSTRLYLLRYVPDPLFHQGEGAVRSLGECLRISAHELSQGAVQRVKPRADATLQRGCRRI